MKKILKYQLGRNGEIVKCTGKFERVLSIMTQNGIPHIWIEENEDAEEITASIIAVGTGMEFPAELIGYLGSAIDGFGYVWHYYWFIAPEEEETAEEETEE